MDIFKEMWYGELIQWWRLKHFKGFSNLYEKKGRENPSTAKTDWNKGSNINPGAKFKKNCKWIYFRGYLNAKKCNFWIQGKLITEGAKSPRENDLKNHNHVYYPLKENLVKMRRYQTI